MPKNHKTAAAAAQAVSEDTVKIAQEPVVTAIKGFNADLQCRGYQFAIGKTYEAAGRTSACSNGFHAIEGNLFEVWSYYGPVDEDGRLSRYAIVEQGGNIDRHSEDGKVASRLLTVKIELSLGEFVHRAIGWVIEATKVVAKVADKVLNNDDAGDAAKIGSSGDAAQIGSSGYAAPIGSSGNAAKIGSSGNAAQIGSSGYAAQIGSSGNAAKIGSSGYAAQIGSSGYAAQIGSSGNAAKIGSSGYAAQIGSSGNAAKIGSSGDAAKIGSSGYAAQIGSSGDAAKIGSSGDAAQIGSSGDAAQIGSSGNAAQIGSSGYAAQIGSSGDDGVIACAGRDARVSGAAGTWISIAEFNDAGKCIGFVTGCVGTGGLKPGVYYAARGGKLIEAGA